MPRLSLTATAASAILASCALTAAAKPCVQFDASWNLYAFGGSEDVMLGQNTTWGSPSAMTLTTSGRPPWTGNNTQCFLSQYNNAMYVLNADASAPSDIYVFNFDAKSWSKQSTSSAPDLSTGTSILDHDTNVFFTLPSGASSSLYQLDLSTITNAASGGAIAWEAVTAPSFQQGGGQGVVMAEASNHINFFNVPSNPAGSTSMFVIHYAYFQPEAVEYKTVNNAASNFPTQHGAAIPVPAGDNSAGDVMVFVPDDFSQTYVVTHWTSPSTAGQTSDAPAGIQNYINTTQTLPPPTSQDIASSYAASDTALVQMDSRGALYYVTGAFGNGWQVASGLSWEKSGYTLAGVTGSGAAAASTTASGMTTSSGMTTTASRTAAASSMSDSAASSGSRTVSSAAASGSSPASGAVGAVDGVNGALVAGALACLGIAFAF